MDSSCSPKLNGYPTAGGRSEGDVDENVDYDHHHHHHQHHQQHQQQQHHPYHHQQEDMVVDNLGMGMNMEMIGSMNAMNGGPMHFSGVDNNNPNNNNTNNNTNTNSSGSNNNVTAEDLRGRPRVVRHPDSDGENVTGGGGGVGGVLKEEEDDGVVVDGFGIGGGRTTRGM